MRTPRLVLWSCLVVVGACGASHAPVASPPPVVANHPPPPAPAPPAPASKAVLAWPVAPFTDAQIAEATGCDVDALATQRYTKELGIDALPAAFAAKSTCDRAVLAAACLPRLKDKDAAPPAACLDAYRAAVGTNPAFAFVGSLPGGYFGQLPLVAPPPAAARAVTDLVLAYSWDGLGDKVAWTLTVHDAATHPTVSVTGPSAPKHVSPPATIGASVAGFAHALGGFLPIKAPLQAVDCTDNYPDWTATLTFDDGSTLQLATHGSNLLGLGGPWQLAVGSANYLQLGPDFTRAVADLVQALDLPIGQPEGEYCRGYDIEAAVLKGGAP